eukprot:XP_016659274.1 PREDICTED: uncharacterized protein LOC103309210 [Acyrthosiphon pisum]
MQGSHTYDVLAKAMETVYYLEFNISDKVIYTTTDNGSNVVKSFKMFGQSSENQPIYNPKEKEFINTLIEKNEDEKNDNVDIEEEGIDFSKIPIYEVLNKDWEDNMLYNSPKHHRCASHTLNLIATSDIEKALRCYSNTNVTNKFSLAAYKKQSRPTFSKCQAIWNKQNHSSQMADIIKTNSDVYLKTPNDTRWNSWFDSTKFLITHFKISPSIFYKVYDSLTVNRFSKADIDFSDVYILLVMEPLCVCLDILQRDM